VGTWQPLPLPFCCCTSASCLCITWSVRKNNSARVKVPVWCKTCYPEICVLSESDLAPGMLAGLIPAILSTPLCLLPQHCLACLEGPCSKGCNHCQCSSVERASLRLVSTPSHQGCWQGPVAQCQCLVTSTYMCGISNFTSTEPKN
jgi:hypothetical protein